MGFIGHIFTKQIMSCIWSFCSFKIHANKFQKCMLQETVALCRFKKVSVQDWFYGTVSNVKVTTRPKECPWPKLLTH